MFPSPLSFPFLTIDRGGKIGIIYIHSVLMEKQKQTMESLKGLILT